MRREINTRKQPGTQAEGLCTEPAFKKVKRSRWGSTPPTPAKRQRKAAAGPRGGTTGAALPGQTGQNRPRPLPRPGPARPTLLRPHLPGAGGRCTGARPLLRLLREGPSIRRSRRWGTTTPPHRRQPQPPRPNPCPGGGKAPARRRHDCPRGGRSVNSDHAPPQVTGTRRAQAHRARLRRGGRHLG